MEALPQLAPRTLEESMTFDRDELAELLLQAASERETAPQDEPGTITTQEFSKATGVTESRARAMLLAAREAGLVEPGKFVRVTVFGDAVRRPGWRFLEPKE